MNLDLLRQLEDTMNSPGQIQKTVDYLADYMKLFLRPGDKIMICFSDCSEGSIGDLISCAARKLGGIPVSLNGDVRWKNILRVAFHSRATVIAGPPFVVLGLTKLARNTKTPLYFRNVITAGYRCTEWMIDGLQAGLDCVVWGCFGPGSGPVVGGFSCNQSMGVHIRDDVFDFEIVDEQGKPVPDGQLGYIVLTPKHEPSVRYHTGERGRIERSICACGNTSPRLMDLRSGEDVDGEQEQLGRELMSWTSILDCRFRMGRQGLEIELVTFPGEKLPKLPECAGRVIRNWDPEKDVPNWFLPAWRKTDENG